MEQITPETSTEDIKKMLKNLVFASIISADNYGLDEETKQEIIRRYDIHKNTGDHYDDWEFILEPIADDKLREKYFRLLD